jgi:phosphoribosylformimino-5-aminoimidazole carboxamide ribotide isomerase
MDEITGAARVIVGTAALSPSFLADASERFGERLVVAIDARDGRIAIKGWKEDTSMDAVELAKRCQEDGASRIIYTDISRDGTSLGVNAEEMLRIARAVKIPIIASGGVASLDDIGRLKALENDGVEGVIVGRALYSGAFTLREAIEVAAKGRVENE